MRAALAILTLATASCTPFRIGHTYTIAGAPPGLHYTVLALDHGLVTYRMTYDYWPQTITPMSETGRVDRASFMAGLRY